MNEILKETKANVVERQILINQMVIMNCLQFSNPLYRSELVECIDMSKRCIKALDKYDNVLQG